MEFENWLSSFSPTVAELAERARQQVLSVYPCAHEVHEPGWGGYWIFKQAPESGNSVCWLTCHSQHTSLGFSDGANLTDPAKILQGSGKRQRHLKFRRPGDVEHPQVRALLAEAWAKQPSAGQTQDFLEQIRQICLSFPGATEKLSHGHPNFYTGKRCFAVYGLYSPSIAFKTSPVLHGQLCQDSRFFPTPYMAHHGWLSIAFNDNDNENDNTNWDFVKRLLVHSFCQVATRKTLSQFPLASLD